MGLGEGVHDSGHRMERHVCVCVCVGVLVCLCVCVCV